MFTTQHQRLNPESLLITQSYSSGLDPFTPLSSVKTPFCLTTSCAVFSSSQTGGLS